MSNKINFNENDLDEIRTMYMNGISYTTICKKFNTNTRTLTRRLKQMGVYIKGKTCIKRKCKHTIDSNYFEVINTEEKAYFLGFIGADGCVMKDSKNRWYLKFHQHIQDRIILDKLLEFLKTSYKIKIDKKRSDIVSLQISDKKLIMDLIKHGIAPNKSLIYQFNDNIPKNLLRHYLRGYFDGDGCTYECKTRNKEVLHEGYHIIGSLNFITKLKQYLSTENIFVNTSFCNKNKNMQISIKSKDTTTIFYKLIYEDCSIFLPRKYNIASKFHF